MNDSLQKTFIFGKSYNFIDDFILMKGIRRKEFDNHIYNFSQIRKIQKF